GFHVTGVQTCALPVCQVVVQLQDIKQFNIDEKEEQEEKLIEVKGQLKDVEARIYSVEAEIERVLKLGDKRKLADEISVLKRNISNQEGIVDVSLKGLRKLLRDRSEEHTSELQSRENIVCRLLLET